MNTMFPIRFLRSIYTSFTNSSTTIEENTEWTFRKELYSSHRNETETAEEWADRLRFLASRCSFSENDTIVRDLFVLGYGAGNIQNRLMQENPNEGDTTLTVLIQIAQKETAYGVLDTSTSSRCDKLFAQIEHHSTCNEEKLQTIYNDENNTEIQNNISGTFTQNIYKCNNDLVTKNPLPFKITKTSTLYKRNEDLKLIHNSLQKTENTTVIIRSSDVTEVANQYAVDYMDYYNKKIFLLECSINIEESFVEVARELSIKTNVEGHKRHIKQIIADIYARCNKNSLFIFNNVSSETSIKDYLPDQYFIENKFEFIKILITSSNTNWGNNFNTIFIPPKYIIDIFEEITKSKFEEIERKVKDFRTLLKLLDGKKKTARISASLLAQEWDNYNFLSTYVENFKEKYELLFEEYSKEKPKYTALTLTLNYIDNTEKNPEVLLLMQEILHISSLFHWNYIPSKFLEKFKNSNSHIFETSVEMLKKLSLISCDNNTLLLSKDFKRIILSYQKQQKTESIWYKKALEFILDMDSNENTYDDILNFAQKNVDVILEIYKINSNKIKLLQLLAKGNRVSILRKLFEQDSNNLVTIIEENLFDEAVYNNYISVITLFLEYKINLNRCNKDKLTPLQVAVYKGFSEITNLLIIAGANVFVIDEKGNTLLHRAVLNADKNIFNIIAPFIYFNKQNNEGDTVLHISARLGLTYFCQTLLEKNCSDNIMNYKGFYPIHEAAFYGHFDVIKIMIKYNSESASYLTKDKEFISHIAVRQGHLNILQYSFDELKMKKLINYLENAIVNDKPDIVEYLLTQGYSVHFRIIANSWGALHYASNNKDGRITTLLIKAGCDINITSRTGNTPLHEAALKGRLGVVQVLCQNGAKENVANNDGCTPLDLARQEGHKDICIFLEQRFPNINNK